MELEIETKDVRLALDIMGIQGTPKSGIKIEIPGGAVLTFKDMVEYRAIDFPVLIRLSVEFLSCVSGGLVANWI
jgi:hypothetical protein